jgi:hypothetical protein
MKLAMEKKCSLKTGGRGSSGGKEGTKERPRGREKRRRGIMQFEGD